MANYFLSAFVQDVESNFSISHPASFWACRTLIERLAQDGGIAEAVNEQLRKLKRDPSFTSDWNGREIYLHRTKTWSLSLVILEAPSRFIHALSELAYYVPLSRNLRAHRYCLPDNLRADVFDSALRLGNFETLEVVKGEALALETDRYAYDLEVAEPIATVRFMTTAMRPLEWLFSKTTLQAWQANDADLASTQLRVAAYVLGKIAHQSSVAPLKNLSTHSHHAVRWAAIQNLGRLNRSEALVKIREAINDPHPHVRKAAQKTLEQLENKAKTS